jgi:hypothetical protein
VHYGMTKKQIADLYNQRVCGKTSTTVDVWISFIINCRMSAISSTNMP